MADELWHHWITDITLNIPAGTIVGSIKEMLKVAREKNANVHAELNDIWVSVSPEDRANKILELFQQAQKDLAEAEKAKPQTPYRRITLYLDEKVEIVLIFWPKGVRSRPHDHGKSHGITVVLKGTIFDMTFDKKTKELIHAGTHVADLSKIMEESPKQIHIIGNASKEEEAITLHIYTPPLKMKYYDDLA